MDKLAVIVVSWNTSELTGNCLDSLYAELARLSIPSEVWVVDNASADDSVAMIKRRFPQTRLIENTENVGFARANNQALRLVESSLCLLLNPDTVVKPGAISQLITFLAHHPEVAAVGPRLILGDGSIQRSVWPLPTSRGELRYCLAYHFPPFGRYLDSLLGSKTPDIAAISTPSRAEVVSAACLLIRRSVLEQVGLLDEEFFLFSEENDFFFRMRKANLTGYYLPEAEVIHLVGQSRRQRDRIDSETNFLRSRLIYFRHTDPREFARVRRTYGFFLAWSTAFTAVCGVLRRNKSNEYSELYRSLRRTFAEVR